MAGVAHWHIGADEPRALDYNLELKGDDRFRGDEPFASSDHDPLLVGLNLTSRVSGVQTSSGCRGGSFTFSLVLACGVPWRRAGAKRSRRGGAPA